MNKKKIQSLIVAGIISTSTLFSNAIVYADEILTTKDVKVETVSRSTGVESVVPEVSEDSWLKTTTMAELQENWNYQEDGDIIVLTSYKKGATNPIVEIPREIENRKVELQHLNKDTFPDVTHIRVAEGEENNKVKLRATNLRSAFNGTTTLEYADLRGLDVSDVTVMWCIFSDNDVLRYLNLEGWDVSNTDDFAEMFYNATALNTVNLSGWNMASSTDTRSIFNGAGVENIIVKNLDIETYKKLKPSMGSTRAEALTIDITGIQIPESETSLSGLFNISKLVNIIGLNEVKVTSNITNLSSMFNGSKITSIDVSGWDTSSVTDMNNMFRDCTNLISIKGLESWEVSEVENMKQMFRGCTNLTNIEGTGTWNTPNLTNAQEMFHRCSNLESIDLTNFNMNNVGEMPWMFSECTSLREIKGTENWTLESATRTREMFSHTKLNLIDLRNVSLPSRITNANMADMFKENEGSSNKKLLVITNDDKLKAYDYTTNNRTPVTTTFNANGGYFYEDTQETVDKAVERFTITPEQAENIDEIIQHDIVTTPIKEGFIFIEWQPTTTATSVFDKIDMTYEAVWEEISIENENEDADGTRRNPYIFKVNTETGLDRILTWLNNTSINTSYYRVGEPTIENGIATYELHVFSEKGLVTYMNIRVDNSNSSLTNKLNAIDKFVVQDIVNQGGDGSYETPHILRVNTIDGLNQLLSSLENDGYIGYYRTETPIAEDRYDITYEIRVVSKDGETTYIQVTVDNLEQEIIDTITGITTDAPTLPEEPSEPEVPEQPETPDDGEEVPPTTPDETPDIPDTDVPDTEEPPVEDDDNTDEVPPVEDGDGSQPPTDEDNGSDEEGGDTEETPGDDVNPQPPIDNTPDTDIPDTEVPPVEDGDNGNTGGDDTEFPPTDTPDTEEPGQPDAPEVDETPEQPPVEDDNNGSDNDNVDGEDQPSDDESTDTPEEDKPAFNHDVVELVSGNGQADSPLELIIKDAVVENQLTGFLTELEVLNPIVLSITQEGSYTVYELKLDKNSELLDKIFKTRNADDSVYAIIKVENSRTELVSALNDFAKETNSSVIIPGTNVDTEVKPEVNKPDAEDTVKPNDSEITEDKNNTVVDKPSVNNPQTGDVSTLGGYILLGATSLLGALGLMKKRNKK